MEQHGPNTKETTVLSPLSPSALKDPQMIPLLGNQLNWSHLNCLQS